MEPRADANLVSAFGGRGEVFVLWAAPSLLGSEVFKQPPHPLANPFCIIHWNLPDKGCLEVNLGNR